MSRSGSGPRIRTLTLATGLNAIAGAAFSAAVARTLGAAGLGSWSLTLTASTWIVIVMSGGTDLRLRYLAGSSRLAMWAVPYARYSLAVVVASAAIGVLAVALTFNVRPELGELALSVGILTTSLLAQRQSQGLANASGQSTPGTLAIAAGTAFAGAAVWVAGAFGSDQLSVPFLATVYSAGTLPPVFFAAYELRRVLAGQKCRLPGVARGGLRGLFEQNQYQVLFALGLALIARMGGFFLAAGSSLNAVGLFAAAASVAGVTRLLPNASGQVLFYRESRFGVDASMRTRVRLITLAAQVASLAVAPVLIHVLYGPDFSEAVPTCIVLVFGEMLIGSALIDWRVLSAAGRTRALGRAMAVVLPAATLAYWLASSYGPIATAFATVFAYAVLAGLLMIARRRA